MELKGNRYGGQFDVTANPAERQAVLGAITEFGLQGLERDELRQNPALAAEIVGAVATGSEWGRKVLETVDATLGTPSTSGDAKVLAARAILKLQTTAALSNSPRR